MGSGMSISEFYHSACSTKQAVSKFLKEENRFSVIRRGIAIAASALVDGVGIDEVVSSYGNYLMANYKESYFNGFSMVMEQQTKDDVKVLERFLKTFPEDAVFIGANQKVSVETSQGTIYGYLTLLVQKGDAYEGYFVFPKKADKSPGGKSMHTNSQNDLYGLIGKASLEAEYPGISIALVYLYGDDPLGEVKPFLITSTKKSNLFRMDFSKYLDGKELCQKVIREKIEEVLAHPVTPDCFNCSSKDICGKNNLQRMKLQESSDLMKEDVYTMPTFTEEQKQIIGYKNGQMLVCAGPGSGKTATLVGRIQTLIESGIEPELILAITFTRDAAGELLKRCASFCKADEMPEILTLNALGYKILRMNAGIYGQEVTLLTKMEQLKLVENLLQAVDLLKGFSYSVRNGQNGLLMTVLRKIGEYNEDPDAFFQKNPDKGADFANLVGLYNAALQSHGYIGYDEQITRAIELIRLHPEVSEGLSLRYKYIMVDEFQDVNAEQAEFVYLLAKHGNLVVVGDDDQNIYGFRGGSNRFMLEFTKRFPKAKRVVLRKNFRSTKEIVDASLKVVAHNNRIKKDIVCTRNKGMKPQILKDQSAPAVDTLLQELLNKYKPKDIAVLATKNKTLEDLAGKLTSPVVLGRMFLKDSPAFLCLLDMLAIYFDGNERNIVHFYSVLGDDLSLPEEDRRYYEFLQKLSALIEKVPVGTFLLQFSKNIGIEGTSLEDSLLSLIDTYHIKEYRKLYETMQYMVDFGEETKVTPNTDDSILLITSHESKGMEWNAVILIDDFSEVSEETNRLYYVAVTRAKDELYILARDGRTRLSDPAVA